MMIIWILMIMAIKVNFIMKFILKYYNHGHPDDHVDCDEHSDHDNDDYHHETGNHSDSNSNSNKQG